MQCLAWPFPSREPDGALSNLRREMQARGRDVSFILRLLRDARNFYFRAEERVAPRRREDGEGATEDLAAFQCVRVRGAARTALTPLTSVIEARGSESGCPPPRNGREKPRAFFSSAWSTFPRCSYFFFFVRGRSNPGASQTRNLPRKSYGTTFFFKGG